MNNEEFERRVEEELAKISEDEARELTDDELEGVAGGVLKSYQKLGIIAVLTVAKQSGYTLDDMDYIFSVARKVQERDGSVGNTTAEELEGFIRSVWPTL